VYNGVWGKAGEILRIFVLQSVRLLLTVSQKIMGEQDVLLAPPTVLLGNNWCG